MSYEMLEIIVQQLVFPLLALVVTSVLVPMILAKKKQIQGTAAAEYADIVINAIQQMCNQGLLEAEKRKPKAVEMLLKKFPNLTEEEAGNLIEGAIGQGKGLMFTMNNSINTPDQVPAPSAN